LSNIRGYFDIIEMLDENHGKQLLSRSILFVQYADPSAYPPLEHSSRLLANRGWNVDFLGTGARGIDNLRFPIHPRIRIKKLRFMTGGWRQKLQYLRFIYFTLYWTWRWKPQWIYASDPPACPGVWLAQKLTNVRVVYHEHDSPDPDQAQSWFMNRILAYRGRLGRDANLCILPQQARLLKFLETTRRTKPAFCVWNCPRLDEIPGANSSQDRELIIYYHGSITSARLPVQLIIAASRFKGAIRVRVAGYETLGGSGYLAELIALAAKNGAPGIIEPLGTIPRCDLLRNASKAQIGLSLMPKQSEDINMQHMVGASNKPFDYMASALPLLVTDLPEWVAMFVDPGYARACDPNDSDSIEAALRWYLEHPDERRQMGQRGQEKIRQLWNYENMFAGVLERLENS
jgi:glycosyltransferase involved in cell wall biosynthesis